MAPPKGHRYYGGSRKKVTEDTPLTPRDWKFIYAYTRAELETQDTIGRAASEKIRAGSGYTSYVKDMLNKPNIDVEHIWSDHYDQHLNDCKNESEFAVVRNKEFFGDRGAELAIEHLLEVGVLLVLVVEEVVEAVDKLLFRKLVDIFLEWIFDKDVLVFDFGVFDRFDDVVGGHVAHNHLLDIFVLEMEEVAGVIPDEAVAIGGFAIAADAVAFFEEGPIVAFVVHGEREARDATTDNNILIHH